MSERPKEGCRDVMVALAIGLLVTPFTFALWGYTTSVLWSWFVVPQFALAPLSVPTAIGISLVLSQFRRRQAPEKDKTTAQVVGEGIVSGIGNPLFALAVGAIVHRWFT
jgi:predicted membrane-bound mannosyltransferase